MRFPSLGRNNRNTRHLMAIEPLEPRQLLSAVEWLPGLMGPQTLPVHAAGQVVYLDFDGAPGICFHGLPNQSLPSSALPDQARAGIAAAVASAVTPLGVSIVTAPPPAGLYSTLYVSGGAAFAALDASFWGIAQDIDVRNARPDDNAFVFAGAIRTAVGAGPAALDAIATVATHEIGHLLGLVHASADPTAVPTLADLAYTQGDWSLFTGGPVHQYLTQEAYALYKAQFGPSELDRYISYVVTGSHDEDVASRDPFDDADAHYWGHDSNFNRTPYTGYQKQDTAVNRAYKYLTGGYGFNNVYDTAWQNNGGVKGQGVLYKYSQGSIAGAYYTLGHIVHLLEDVTVPSHAHADAHGLDDLGNPWDDYETYIGDDNNWKDWNHNNVTGTIRTPAQVLADIGQINPFYSLFYNNATHADDYDSDDAPGQIYHLRDGDSLSDSACHTIGNAMMPLAIKSVAELYRYFLSTMDTTAPTVSFALSTSQAAPSLRQGRFTLTALGEDLVSGVDKNSYHIYASKWSGYSWGSAVDWTAADATSAISVSTNGLYRVQARATNGAGLTASSAYYYVQASTIPGMELPFNSAGICVFIDTDGDTVTATLKGGGTGSIYLARVNSQDVAIIVLNDTTERSTLNISVKGPGGQTALGGLGTNGSPLGSVNAPTCDLSGTVAIGAATTAKGALTLTFDQIANATITSAMPLKSLSASEWLDSDATPDVLRAPTVGTINIKGAKANALAKTPALRGDFQADLDVGLVGAEALALGTLSITGVLDRSTITARGHAANGLSIGTLNAGRMDDSAILADAGINLVSTSQWLGTVNAGWLGSLVTKAKPLLGGLGDVRIHAALSGAALPAKKAALGTVSIAGNLLSGSQWQVTGFMGSLTVAGAIDGTTITASGLAANGVSLTSLKAARIGDCSLAAYGGVNLLATSQWQAGTITAGWIGSLVTTVNAKLGATGDIGADLLLTGTGVAPKKATLGTLTVAGSVLSCLWDIRAGFVGAITVARVVDHTLIRSAGDINSLTVGASNASDYGAGVRCSLLQSSRHVAPGDSANAPTATIKAFTIKGWTLAKGQAIPRFFCDSNISARLAKLNLLNWDGRGGAFAPAGTVKSIQCRDSADPTRNWTYPAQNYFVYSV